MQEIDTCIHFYQGFQFGTIYVGIDDLANCNLDF